MSLVPLRWSQHWTASAFDLLKGTPFNCLVIDHAGKMPSFVEEAGKRKLEVIVQGPGGIPQSTIEQASWDRGSNIVALSGSAWPGVQTGAGGRASAGPTGTAWVDSNGWAIRLAGSHCNGRTVWTTHVPPSGALVDALSYELAIADSAAYGGRWIVALDDALARGMASGNADALGTWRRICAAGAQIARFKEWTGGPALARVGILSGFRGKEQGLAHEVLNLAARRHLPYRILIKEDVATGVSSFDNLQAVLYVDNSAPEDGLRRKLEAFTEAGGLLFVPTALASLAPAGARAEAFPRHAVYPFGKGKLAVATAPPSDPYLLAADLHLILSRRADLIRAYNAPSLNLHLTGPADQSRVVVQVLNYSRRPSAQAVTIQLTRKYQKARMLSLDGSDPREFPVMPVPAGVELQLPEFPIYLAFELQS